MHHFRYERYTAGKVCWLIMALIWAYQAIKTQLIFCALFPYLPNLLIQILEFR
jgi:hypothetical protein